MVTELLTLRDLRVQTLKERKEGRLTKMPTSFYEQVKNLENQIKKVIEDSKDNVKRLEKSNSDMRKLMDLKLDLHKLRERKLTDLAREKVNGQNPNTDNVHPNESEYLESICSVIEKHRENTLLSTDFDFIPEKIVKKPKMKVEKKPEMKKEKEPERKVENKPDNPEYLSVKVLEDLPTFTGMDAKNYTLKNGDIESIPIYNARMLSDAGKVKLVKEVKV
jgi:DNA replication factor GINS